MKQHGFKKIVALLLSCFFFFCAPPNVFAANKQAIDAAEKLYSLDLFKGVGNDSSGKPIFDLDRAPSREEAITMLVRLLGKETEALSGAWTTPFKDVSDWAKPYVGYAYTNKITTGTSATTFGGSDAVTAAQYITLVLRALGYSDSRGDFVWNTPWTLSDPIGLTKRAYNENNNASFKRGDVAIVSAAALDCTLAGTNKLLRDQIFAQAQSVILVENDRFCIELDQIRIHDSYTEIKFNCTNKVHPDDYAYDTIYCCPSINAITLNGVTYGPHYGFISVNEPVIPNGETLSASVLLSVGKNTGFSSVNSIAGDIYFRHGVMEENMFFGAAMTEEEVDGRFSYSFPNTTAVNDEMPKEATLVYSDGNLDIYHVKNKYFAVEYIAVNKKDVNITIRAEALHCDGEILENVSVRTYDLLNSTYGYTKAIVMPKTWTVFSVEGPENFEYASYNIPADFSITIGDYLWEQFTSFTNHISTSDWYNTDPSQDPEQKPTTGLDSPKVYITATGSRYHHDSTCNGGTYYESTLEIAKRAGLTPCEKCVLSHVE